jgi:hypothetical protein
MGKGSLFMGMGRGKVGEVVFSRQDGEQIFRARNRHPHNPQTNKQLVQRAIMATVMSAYSAGREIFDHSFQGYSVGAGCQRRFLSLNANALRTQLATEWDTAAAEESLAKVTAPKIQTPIPNQYVISEGSAVQSLFTFDGEGGYYSWNLPAPNTNEKVNEYAARVGLQAGDIYTFVFISTSKADNDVLYKALGIASVDFDTIYRGSFGWVRFIGKNVAANNDAITSATLMSVLFDIEQGGSAYFGATAATLANSISIDAIKADVTGVEDNGYAIGLIKSRRDIDLRSNSTMYVGNPDEFGLYWNDVLTAWKAGTTQIGASDLILEGGDE